MYLAFWRGVHVFVFHFKEYFSTQGQDVLEEVYGGILFGHISLTNEEMLKQENIKMMLRYLMTQGGSRMVKENKIECLKPLNVCIK